MLCLLYIVLHKALYAALQRFCALKEVVMALDARQRWSWHDVVLALLLPVDDQPGDWQLSSRSLVRRFISHDNHDTC